MKWRRSPTGKFRLFLPEDEVMGVLTQLGVVCPESAGWWWQNSLNADEGLEKKLPSAKRALVVSVTKALLEGRGEYVKSLLRR